VANEAAFSHQEQRLAARKVLVIACSALLVILSGALALLGGFFPKQQNYYEFGALMLGPFGAALLTISVSEIWWHQVTRDEAQRNLALTIAHMFTQDPEFVAQYFKPSEILGFVNKNMEARTHDPDLSKAITNDLIGPFLEEDQCKNRVRTACRYSIAFKHEEDMAAGLRGKTAGWRVLEVLSFSERLPIQIHAGSILSVFVFCEAGLRRWFWANDCMYRSVAFAPEGLIESPISRRVAWAEQHLDCSLTIDGIQLALEKQIEMEAPDCNQWAVKFALKAGDAEKISELQANARKNAPLRGEVPSMSMVLQSKTTHSPKHSLYTAYLAYPTFNPRIEFLIDGPVDRLEWAEFYSKSTPAPGSSEPDNIEVQRLDGLADSRHVEIALAQPRWVFPMSGVSFTWTMCEPPGPNGDL
jgi:hypothetical protein